MSDVATADLANTVTAFATILSGIIALGISALTKPQPARWHIIGAFGFIVLWAFNYERFRV